MQAKNATLAKSRIPEVGKLALVVGFAVIRQPPTFTVSPKQTAEAVLKRVKIDISRANAYHLQWLQKFIKAIHYPRSSEVFMAWDTQKTEVGQLT